jgi:hypothetical protein
MEYREGRGMVLFCEMDVTGRTEPDPAAARLVGNLIGYVSAWKPAPTSDRVLWAGDAAGKAHLESLGLQVDDATGAALPAGEVLVVGPGGGRKLTASAAAVRSWLARGGSILTVGLDQEEADAFLPFRVTTKRDEHVAAIFPPPAAGSALAGISPAEVYVRDPRPIPQVTGGAEAVGDGVLAVGQGGRVVFCQLAPWQYDYRAANPSAWNLGYVNHNVKPTFRRTSFLLSRLLGNLGAAPSTPLLQRFGKPPVDGEPLQDVVDALSLEGDGKEIVLSTQWKGLSLTQEAPGGWQALDFDDSRWQTVRVPGPWARDYSAATPPHHWEFLHRLRFDVPADMAGADMAVVLGPVQDEDWVYLNGHQIGGRNGNAATRAPRRYPIPKGLLRPGENVLAVRTHNWGYPGGILPMTTLAEPDRRQLKRLEDPVKYLPADSARYLSGLYLDFPTYYDDPYRYERW